GAYPVLEHLTGDQRRVRMGPHLCKRVFAPAEADFQPERPFRQLRYPVGRQGQARQCDVEKDLLAGPQLMAAAAAIESIRRWLYRPKAAFSAGTRSVISHVKVPFSASGSRPKWP